jgi:hypothetical protein
MRRITETLKLERYTEGARDSRGNIVRGFLPPEDLPVFAVSAKSSVEADELGRRAVVTGKTVFAPAGTVVGPHDRVTRDGLVYEVLGEPADWLLNPHRDVARQRGVQFDMERADG